MTDDVPFRGGTLDAGGPFDFSLSTEGDLLISFRLQGFPMQIAVPSAELGTLQRLLEATGTIRGMLGAKPPSQGGH